MGCTKQRSYQDTLAKCANLSNLVPVRIIHEPDNPYDCQAIAFQVLNDEKWINIGYVLHEQISDVD
jgi:hypothetical protein